MVITKSLLKSIFGEKYCHFHCAKKQVEKLTYCCFCSGGEEVACTQLRICYRYSGIGVGSTLSECSHTNFNAPNTTFSAPTLLLESHTNFSAPALILVPPH
jgi:hypothetical protein